METAISRSYLIRQQLFVISVDSYYPSIALALFMQHTHVNKRRDLLANVALVS